VANNFRRVSDRRASLLFEKSQKDARGKMSALESARSGMREGEKSGRTSPGNLEISPVIRVSR